MAATRTGQQIVPTESVWVGDEVAAFEPAVARGQLQGPASDKHARHVALTLYVATRAPRKRGLIDPAELAISRVLRLLYFLAKSGSKQSEIFRSWVFLFAKLFKFVVQKRL